MVTTGHLTDTVGPSRVPATAPRRLSDRNVALGVGLFTALACCTAQVLGTHFFYAGDQNEQFMPLWRHFGLQLRDGNWPTMEPEGWAGGNFAAEGLLGIWNPFNMANFVLVSYFDDLSLAAFLVMTEILVILSVGVYLLAREYGAARWAAAIVGTAIPVSGFTLWYEASGWPAGLMAFSWTTHFWWAAHRYARGRLNPIVPVIFGVLAVTTGNPYGTVGVLVVLTAVGAQLLADRRFAEFRGLVLVGACTGTACLAVFLPLLGTSGVTDRQHIAELQNDTFLVPDLGDLAASGSPTYLPSISNWDEGRLEAVPSTYFAWFVLPLLPWLRVGWLRERWRALLAPIMLTALYLAATVGPSNVWMFRWPVRVVEYTYLGAAVIFAVWLSGGLALDHFRRRVWMSAALVLAGVYLAWAVRPRDLVLTHVLGLAVVGAAVTGAVAAWPRFGARGLTGVVLAGTLGVLAVQAGRLPDHPYDAPSPEPAYDVARLEASVAGYQGRVLQLADPARVSGDQRESGTFMFGNTGRMAGLETVVSYTGMGFEDFGAELCMNYKGATCAEAYDRLWAAAGDGVDGPLIDVMGVSTLVLQRSLLPEVVDGSPPAGWRVLDAGPARVVWVRVHPLRTDTRVTWTSPGVEVTPVHTEATREEFRVFSARGGTVVLARLDWPGYSASARQRQLTVRTGPAGLVAIDVPPGELHVVLEFASPGLRAGAAVGVVGAVVALGHATVWIRRRRPPGVDIRRR